MKTLTKMKKLLFTLTFLTLGYTVLPAQKADRIIVNVLSQEVTIGTMKTTISTSIDDVIKYLGEPERKETIAGKERIFAYDKLGIAFDIGNGTKKTVEGISVTYVADDDRKVAKGGFNGDLLIDNLKISATMKPKDIQAKTKFGNIECFSAMCASNPKAKGLMLILSYTSPEQIEIGQIGFGFK